MSTVKTVPRTVLVLALLVVLLVIVVTPMPTVRSLRLDVREVAGRARR